MIKVSIATAALLGLLTSVAAIALLYLGNTFVSLPFVPFDLFDWLARILPGNLVTLGIDTIVSLVRTLGLGATDTTSKRAEQLLALSIFVLGGVALGIIIASITRSQPQRGRWIGVIAGMIVFALVAALEVTAGLAGNPLLALAWLAFVFVGWGLFFGHLIQRLASVPSEARRGRRALLAQIAAGSVGLAVVAWGIDRLLQRGSASSGAGQPLANQPSAPANTTPITQTTAATDERIEPAPGTRPEITSNADFYRIDINLQPPNIDESSWVLETAGLLNNPRPLTLQDLMAMPAVTQPLTLSCISNPIGGDLISASQWTGVRLRDLLEELGLRAEAQELRVEAADGFFESVAMADMMDERTLLVYGMNGETLPVEHGFPLRIYIPNRYGMKQPKWITRIEAIDSEGPGYWVERGWSSEARPHVISIIDTVTQDALAQATGDTIPIGGIAWAGDRGIQKVEIQVDEDDWMEAMLRTPPLSGLIWVQWRYDWPRAAGEHTFRVRAVDGAGTLQEGEPSDPHPDGATGYHSVTVTI